MRGLYHGAYHADMPQLIAPTVHLRASWLASRHEWGLGVHQSNAGLTADDDVETYAGFCDWVERLRREADPAVPPKEDRVHATNWWVVENDEYLGAIQLRHYLSDFLLDAGGHIGYGIRPSARRRGYATWAVGAVLSEARALGLTRVLITCDEDNAGSACVIERNGGVSEDVRVTSVGRKRRYWITLLRCSTRDVLDVPVRTAGTPGSNGFRRAASAGSVLVAAGGSALTGSAL